MARLDIKDQAAHDAKQIELAKFHPGYLSLSPAPRPREELNDRIARLEREIIEAAVNDKFPGSLARQLIAARAMAAK